ncbi:MAG: hypothetical protein ACK5LY_01755 [Lachnospirales bacterium]
MNNKNMLFGFLLKNCPFKIKEIFIGELKGLEVFLPITREDALDDIFLYKDILRATKEEILDTNLDIKKFYNVLEPLDIDIVAIKLLGITDVLNYTLDSLKIKKGSSKICVILCENDFKNMFALGKIIDYGKEIIIFGKNISEEIIYFCDRVYEEFGIYISIMKDEKNFVDYLVHSDIVINLENDDDNIVHKLKSGSAFLDFSKDILKSKSILALREDVFNFKYFNFKINKDIYTMEDTYLILQILDKNFNEYLKEKDLSITLEDFKNVKINKIVTNNILTSTLSNL